MQLARRVRTFALVFALSLPAAIAFAQTNDGYVPKSDPNQVIAPLKDTAMPPGPVVGRVYIPDTKAGVLIQPAGRDWRDFRIGPARWIVGGLVIVALVAIAIMAVLRGSTRIAPDPDGRRLLRFRAFDRFIHWITAISFVVLALTGLNLVLGRPLILPWLGPAAFAVMTQWGKILHNFVAFPFMLGILLMAFLWMRDNFFDRTDAAWLRAGGGLLGGEEPPAGKFNAGQKGIYWIALLGGVLVAITGLMLLFPFYLTDVGGMQYVQIVHVIIAALMIAVIIGHIYLGTVGVRGSFHSMTDGTVDLNWARQHHPLWVEAELHKTPAKQPGSAAPAD